MLKRFGILMAAVFALMVGTAIDAHAKLNATRPPLDEARWRVRKWCGGAITGPPGMVMFEVVSQPVV